MISNGRSEAIDPQRINPSQLPALVDPSDLVIRLQLPRTCHLRSPQLHNFKAIMLVVWKEFYEASMSSKNSWWLGLRLQSPGRHNTTWTELSIRSNQLKTLGWKWPLWEVSSGSLWWPIILNCLIFRSMTSLINFSFSQIIFRVSRLLIGQPVIRPRDPRGNLTGPGVGQTTGCTNSWIIRTDWGSDVGKGKIYLTDNRRISGFNKKKKETKT